MNKKVYILTILVFVMAINAVFSQTTTKKLSYQAVVRNAANELVVNQNLSVEITILNANNVPQYKETHATVPTNQNGLLWLWVGDGTPTLGTMDNVVWKDATIKSVFTLPDGSTVTQNTPVTAMPHALFADEVDTVFLQDYLTSHNYGNDDYVTHQELNDTLNHYYTNEQVDAALIPYATNAHLNDTLSHYLMKEVQVLSISHDTIFLTGGSFVVLPKGFSGSYHDLVDTPTNVSAFNNDAGYLTEHQSLEGYVTNDKLKDTLNSYYTKGNVDTKLNDYEKKSELCGDVKECIKDTLAAYYDTTRTQSVISDTATALRAMMGDAANDGIITIDVSGGTIENPTFSVNQANNQTVKITIPEAIPAEDGQLTIIAAGDTTRFTANQATNDTVRLNKFATKDTLAAYYDTTHTKDVISDTATALRAMMVDAANDGQLTIIAAGDTTRFTANQATNDTMRLNKFATKDTLAAYYDTADVKQMLKPYLKANELCDSIVKCDVIKDIRDSLDNAFDTLKYYTTSDQIDTLLDAYATTEELALYELQENLCKDVKTCIKDTLGKYTTSNQIDTLLRTYYDTTHTKSVISDTATALRAMMGDAAYNAKITLKKNNVELDSFRLNQQTDKAINIPVPTTVAELSDAGNYVTKTKLNDTLGAYYDTANVKQMLKPYLKANELCDSIVKCDVIKDMRDSLDNAFDTLKYYYTSKKINDTLKHYYDTAYVNQTLKQYLKSGDLCDSIEKNCTNVALKNKDNLFTYRNQFDSTVFFKNETQFDSIAYFKERTYFDKDVNIDGDVIFKGYNYYYDVNNFYEHGAIVLIDEAVNPNTLGPVQSTQDNTLNRKLAVNYNDLMVVYDTLKKQEHNDNAALSSRIVADSNRLVEFKGKVHNDSLALAERIDTIYRHLCDSVMNCTDIKTMQTDIAANKTNIGLNKQAIIDSSAHIRNEIKNGQITIAVNRSTTTTETTVTNPTFGVNQEADQTVTINIPQETTVNNGQLTIVAAGDTTRFTANQAANDTMRLDKFATKEALKDTAKTLRGIICDSATACITKALADPTSEINHAIDTIARHHVSDSTRMVFDTLHKYYATKDTLKNFVNKLAIRDSVNKVVTDSLRKGPSEMTRAIDSIARHHISDSTRMVFDTLHKYYATKDTLKNFVNKLAIRDSVNKIVTDSLRKGPSEMTRAIDSIARHHVSDSTRMVFDTLHKYYATKDTLKNFVNKLAIRDSVNKVVKDSLRIGTSAINIAIDTIARHNIHDTAVAIRTHIRDSVNVVMLDSLKLGTSAINQAIDTIARHNIHDTAVTIRNSIGNGTLTIQKNGSTVGTFTANQSTDQPVNVNITVPTAVTDLSDAADYAKINGNTFTGTHNFNNASITVPSNTDAIKRPVPATTPAPDCNNMNAVNVCDLLAVFDSLTKRIDSLSAELAAIKNAAPPVYNNDLSFSNVTTTTMTVTASFTSPGFNITSYTLCYSTHENMSDSLVVTSNTPELANTNHAPKTTYYVTMSATNVIGTTTSPKASKLTRSNAPTANVTGITTTPSGITVTLNNLDFKEPVEGTVEIYYKKKTDASCGTNLADYPVHVTSETISNTTTSTYSRFISTPESETPYCVIVKLINADTTTILAPIEVTSGTMDEFEIKSDYEGYYGFPITSFWPCKTDNTITVQFVAVPKVNSIDNYANYTFNWSFEPVPHQSGKCCQDLPIYEILKNNKDTFQVKFTSYASSLAAMRVICTATNAQTSEGITGSVVHRVRQYNQNISVYRPTISEIINGKTVQINSSLYDLIYWGDGTDTLNTDTLDTSDPASGRHEYSEPGDYTIWVLKKTIQSGGDNYFVCDASKTITVVEPPANKYTCHVSTPHQGTGYENNGYNNGSGPANDGYEETDASGKITSVTDYDGNVYPVVQIGSQCWIAKNMRCEHSPNTGNYIVNSQNKQPGDNYFKTYASKSAHWLHNDPDIASSDTGLLYNFCAAADVYNGTELNTLNQTSWTPTINTPYHRGICPKGWHLPTYDDWNTLRNNENANTAAKVAGDGWPSPSGGCGDTKPCSESLNHNVSGFSALLTCYMNYNSWNTLSTDGTGFWSSSCTSGKASGSVLTTGSGSLPLQNNYYKFSNLFSVRCIRDAEPQP